MDAWDILTANSSINDGDAWEHFNTQTGTGGTVIVTGFIEANSIVDIQDINLIVDETSFDLSFSTSAEVVSPATSAEVLSLELTADTITEVR